MRSISTCLLVVMLLAPAFLSAQVEDQPKDPMPKNAVMVNLGGIAVNRISLGYYRALDDRFALGLNGGWLFHPVGNQRAIGYEAFLAVRYHPGEKAPWRFYWSGTAGYQIIGVKAPDATTGGPTTGFVTGWQWFPEERLAVGLGIGVEYKFGGNGTPNDAILKAFGTQPVLSFDIGFAW